MLVFKSLWERSKQNSLQCYCLLFERGPLRWSLSQWYLVVFLFRACPKHTKLFFFFKYFLFVSISFTLFVCFLVVVFRSVYHIEKKSTYIYLKHNLLFVEDKYDHWYRKSKNRNKYELLTGWWRYFSKFDNFCNSSVKGQQLQELTLLNRKRVRR